MPLAPVNVLSKEAGMTSVTFAKRMAQLHREGILISVSAEIVYPTLDLHPYFFFIETPFESIAAVERAMDLHPYTRFRVRCLGSTNGHFTQFAVPNGSLPLLLEFLDGLRDLGLIEGYRYNIATSSYSSTETDFRYYDPKEDTWGFDWGGWEEGFSGDPPALNGTQSAMKMLDGRDMRILRQMTVNARDRRTAIAERAGVPNYFLTRRLKLYHEQGVIRSYRVIVHRDASRLFSTLLFECRCPISYTGVLSEAVSRLPFQSTLIPVKDGFLLQTALPSVDLPHLGVILQKHCEEVRVLWNDYDSSMRYWFWDEPFKEGRWLSSRDFIVNDVLKQLRNEL